MKAILILLTVLTFEATALANTKTNDKINGIEMDIVLVAGADRFESATQVEISTDTKIVRLYKFQNSRVKKALSFTIKKDPAKLA